MPFPYHDQFWTETAGFIRRHYRPGELLVGPDEFVDEFPATLSYLATFQQLGQQSRWWVLHKGRLDQMHHAPLLSRKCKLRPVFANAVFVVLSDDPGLPPLPASSDHVRALSERLAKWPGPRPREETVDLRLHPRPDITLLSTEQIRAEMNQRYARPDYDEFSGYEHIHLWDKVRYHDLERTYQELIGSVRGLDVVEIGCGMGRNVAGLLDCKSYVGIDLSDVAIEKAGARFGEHPHVRFIRTDAHSLDLPAASCDLALLIEMVEHVHDIDKVLAEVCRVLRPNGRIMLNSANRDSLHLRITRKRGLPDFKATKEHIREFGYAEMCGLLQQQGFAIEEGRGAFLQPYYGVPDLDQHVRHLTDDDPEMVEWLRVLGERAGPEFGYEFLVTARKAA